MPTQCELPKAVRKACDDPGQVGIVIVSEIRFLREALAEILSREKSMSILGVSGSLLEAVSMCIAVRPDFILLDAAFGSALAAVGALRNATPNARVVGLAIAETEQDVISWAEAGAAGYVPKTAALSDLVHVIGDINSGAQPCSGLVAAGLLRRLRYLASDGRAHNALWSTNALTARELEISMMISTGLSNKEIARRLNIGLATTKSHVHNLLRKLNVHRRGQVTAFFGERPRSS